MFWPKPDTDLASLDFLKAQPFAHRGLHDAAAGIPENSLAAFDRAIEAGVGIELDIRLTKDGDVVVFHDEELDRMTDGRGPLNAYNRDALRKFRIGGTSDTIMTLHDTLIHIRGRVPVLIEAKTLSRAAYQNECFAIRRALEGYKGGVAVMSFNPELPGWFSRHHPKVIRGLVMTEANRRALSKYNIRKRLRRQLLIWRAQPHFLAYDVAHLPSPVTETARAKKLPVLTWTVRTPEELALASKYADEVIFEGAVPEPRRTARVQAA